MTGIQTVLYADVLDRLKRHGIHLPAKAPGAARYVDVQCPHCAAHNPADLSLRVHSRMHNAELVCRGGCEPVRILQTIGFAQVQQIAPPPRRDGHEQHGGQVRIAYRLHDARRHDLTHVHGLGWLYYDGRRWQVDNHGYAQRAVLDVLREALAESVEGDHDLRKDVAKCESANGIAGVLAVAAALPGFAARPDDLDADPWLLNLSNGTYDLRTDELRPHDPLDRITKITNGAYDPGASGEVFTTFLNRVLPDSEVRGYLQRCAGVALLGKVVEHNLPILTGQGGNGKGVWYGALLFALGDYAAAADPELFTYREGEHSTGQMDLFGRRLVVVSESEDGRRLGAAKMKRLTGGDRIKARYMHRDFIEFTPSHTAFLVTNHLPKAPGDDHAVWRRVRVVPFDVVIPDDERDVHLGDKLQLEADAIVGWAIAGWKAHRDNDSRIAEPAQVLAATNTYQRDSDAVGRFIDDECTTTSPVLQATTKELFDRWETWRFHEGVEQISQKAFGLALDRRGFPVTSRTATARYRGGIDLSVKLT